MPIKKIHDPIYNIDLHFIFDVPLEKARKYLQQFADFYDFSKLETNWKECAAFAYSGQGHSAIIIFPIKKSFFRFSSILAHEGLHVTCGVMESMGIKLNIESEEAFAHYLTWIMQSLTDIYESHYKLRRKK